MVASQLRASALQRRDNITLSEWVGLSCEVVGGAQLWTSGKAQLLTSGWGSIAD